MIDEQARDEIRALALFVVASLVDMAKVQFALVAAVKKGGDPVAALKEQLADQDQLTELAASTLLGSLERVRDVYPRGRDFVEALREMVDKWQKVAVN